jgi:hypothetical protein
LLSDRQRAKTKETLRDLPLGFYQSAALDKPAAFIFSIWTRKNGCAECANVDTYLSSNQFLKFKKLKSHVTCSQFNSTVIADIGAAMKTTAPEMNRSRQTLR